MSDLYFSTKSPVENGTTSYDYNYDGDNFTIITLCEEEHDFGTLTTALFTLVFVLSMTGNVLVLCVITKYEDMKKVTNIFILNLAVSDLLFAFSLPFWAVYHSYQWIFGDFMCKLMSGSYFIGFHSSLIFLMAITVERYLTVVHGGSRMLKKRTLYAQVACVVIWLISIATSVKEMMVSVTVETNGTITCEEEGTSSNQVGYYLHIVLLFLLPLFIIVFCYCCILKTVLSCTTKKKFRAVKIIFCIVVTFFICWAPYNLILFLLTLNEYRSTGQENDCERSAILDLAFIICRNLAYCHCCLNPLLYCFTKKFRGHLATLICNSPLQKRAGEHENSNSSFIIQKAAVVHDRISLSTKKMCDSYM